MKQVERIGRTLQLIASGMLVVVAGLLMAGMFGDPVLTYALQGTMAAYVAGALLDTVAEYGLSK